jgi:hypothetical protein
MTLSYQSAGTAVAASGASPQNITTTVNLAAGDGLLVVMAYDNSGGGGADPIGAISTSANVVGTVVASQAGINDPGAASAGLATKAYLWTLTSPLASGSVVSLDWTGTVVVRAVALVKVTSSAGTVGYRTSSGGTGTNVVASAAPGLTTPSVNSGELVLCYAGHEYGAAPGADADTTNGTWGSAVTANTGSTTSGMAVIVQGKVVTATATQAFNPTGTSSDWILGAFVLTEVIPQAVTQAAYQFYADGTETASVALAAQDTAPTVDATRDVGIQLRVRLQSTTTAAIAATDDFQLQYEKNSSGSWVNAVGFGSTNLTDGNATTNRLTGGTGTFSAGKISEDGLADNVGWPGNNFTELLFSILVDTSTFSNGDIVRYRVLFNGVVTNMTYTVTPTLNVVAAVITQAAYQFFADGSESASTALAAQNTALSGVDLDPGNVNLQLRVRLQSSSSIGPGSLDDWQLQYERNALGAWKNVMAPGLIDVYPAINAGTTLPLTTTNKGYSQSFIGDGRSITRVSFRVTKMGTPDGTIQAYIYATDGGTYGVNSRPSGAALATSSTIYNNVDISTTASMVPFDFPTPLPTVAGTVYHVAIISTNSLASGNDTRIGNDNSSPTHPGNGSVWSGSAWSGTPTDLIFEVYGSGTDPLVCAYDSANLTDSAATTNRLTGGTGTFTAGEVSEDGRVDRLTWAVNNHTEVLFSFTLMAASLVNSDTLRFRITRNGVVADSSVIYAVTPMISVLKTPVGGKVKVWTGSAWVEKPVKVWTGSAWVEKPLKVWSGSAWVLS